MEALKTLHCNAVIVLGGIFKTRLGEFTISISWSPRGERMYWWYWVGSVTDRRSTIWCCVMLEETLSYRRGKSSILFLGRALVEYRTAAQTTCELVWLNNFFHSWFWWESLIRLVCDNQVALHISLSPVFHELVNTVNLIIILYVRNS